MLNLIYFNILIVIFTLILFLSMSTDTDSKIEKKVNEYRLFEDNELRIELANEEAVFELLEGSAEIFGSSLSLHKRYTLPPG